jgi:phosphoribosylpyrophosphate synthetase
MGDVFPCTSAALSAAPLIGRWIERTGRNTLVVGPDEESAPWIRRIAEGRHGFRLLSGKSSVWEIAV